MAGKPQGHPARQVFFCALLGVRLLKIVKLIGLVTFCGLSVVATNAMAAGERGDPSSVSGLNIERLGELILGKRAADAADSDLAPTIAPKLKNRLKRVKPLRFDPKYRNRYVELAARYAKQYGIPYALVDAVMRVESRYKRTAYNGGAVGLMQIKPGTARDIGYSGTVSGLYAPETNIKYGVKYLAGAYQRAGGDICGAIMRYQSGYYARRINSANLAYCAKVQSIMVSLDSNAPA
ncbi:lytic transglycosylase domain-containing protein [Chelatococcus sp. GCM10030263]|uniref:lytic transglycosylase domain-containing protein n=1 Tax=Chelatococcus sp. GCM10030263 TaxID=3273387 RepID=UPI003607C0D7